MKTSCKHPFKPIAMSPYRFLDLRQKSDNPFFNDDAMLMSNQFSNLFSNLKCQASFMADPPVTENMLETSTHIDESIPNEPCQIIVFRAEEEKKTKTIKSWGSMNSRLFSMSDSSLDLSPSN